MKKDSKASSKQRKKRKTPRFWVRFDVEKAWVYDDLMELVEKKKAMGLGSSLSEEVSRIIESYLTGIYTGKETDYEFLERIRKEFFAALPGDV